MKHLILTDDVGNHLQLNDYIASRVAGVTGELWMGFIDFPDTPPIKISDVVAGQKISIPYSTNQPVRFFLVTHDASGRKIVYDLKDARTLDIVVGIEPGVPVLIPNDYPLVNIYGGSWVFTFKKPLQNNFTARLLEVRLINISRKGNVVGDYPASAANITLTDASSLPDEGKLWNLLSEETITYTGKSGNTITGVVRGAELSSASAIAGGTELCLVEMQKQLGDVLTWQLPQTTQTYYVEYRWQNAAGWSAWSKGGFCAGIDSTAGPQPDEPPVPPVADPPPPSGYENPYDPYRPGICFAGRTLFNLTLDESIPFADLYRRRKDFIGQDVLAFDKKTNTYTRRKLLSVHRVKYDKFVDVKFADGLKITATPTHPFWTEHKKMVAIGELKPGDKVFDKNFKLVEIVSMKFKSVKNPQWFYNATVDVDHNYFVGLAVSNNSPIEPIESV